MRSIETMIQFGSHIQTSNRKMSPAARHTKSQKFSFHRPTSTLTPFFGMSQLMYKMQHRKWFFIQRASHQFKAGECKSWRAFDFGQLLNKNMFKRTLKIPFFIDKSWRCNSENNSENLVIFKFRNSRFGYRRQLPKNRNTILYSRMLKWYDARRVKK